jgi:hypothetical protein
MCPPTRALCCTWTCLSTRALCCTWMCPPTRALCCTWTCLSTRTFAVPVRVCLPVTHLDVSAYIQEYRQRWNCRCSVKKNFWFVSVCFETDMFISVVSIHVRNTETNRKSYFLVSWNKPKHNRNRLSFGSFRFEPKIFFVCFEDTLSGPDCPCPRRTYSVIHPRQNALRRLGTWNLFQYLHCQRPLQDSAETYILRNLNKSVPVAILWETLFWSAYKLLLLCTTQYRNLHSEQPEQVCTRRYIVRNLFWSRY